MGVGRATRVRVGVGALALMTASAALAELPESATAHSAREIHSVAALAIFGGLVAFAVILSLLHLYERGRWTRRERELAATLDALRGAHDRAEMLLDAERQILVTWDRRSEPVVEGDISLAIHGARPTSGPARRILAFGTWLVAADATAIETAVEALRARGTSFALSLQPSPAATSRRRARRWPDGRCCACARPPRSAARSRTCAIPWTIPAAAFRPSRASSTRSRSPVWRRNREGGLAWVNTAYVAAVEAGSREAAIQAGIELLDRPAREMIAREDGHSAGLPAAAAPLGGGGGRPAHPRRDRDRPG